MCAVQEGCLSPCPAESSSEMSLCHSIAFQQSEPFLTLARDLPGSQKDTGGKKQQARGFPFYLWQNQRVLSYHPDTFWLELASSDSASSEMGTSWGHG